ncbi:pyridoxal phosphate-dependent aminotransferase [Bacillus suaedaesalsae]|uniref:Pyridoxal phosphate-dependent aminotransferase n=1 Tax=Bacillus suaedaesalsae TaxID=2810349 RepID=A0ABS2DKV2_9BACI|nr:pyridoxal phosphate-dependent aminotransferase [Bacillus suaedaesalsae]MBM6618103.1 pyridoxal phosphate-dependent aminotransferase [Bacillus suaedaesalsae]
MKTFEQSDLLKNLPVQFFATLVAKVNKVISEGHDVINLGQGNPDQPTPEHIINSLQEAAGNPLHHKYSPFRGQQFFKEAISTFYKREYGVEVNPNTQVAILFGGKAGLVEVPQALLNPGDIALVPDPGYPDYWSGVELARVKMEYMPLTAENDFLPNYHEIDDEILNQAKLMFLNYPNNPTGAVATTEFFKETIDLAKKHDICVVHDFAYGAIGFDGNKPLSFLQVEGAMDIGIEIYTLSKTYNMAGWRVGFAVGNESAIEAINLLQDHLYVSLFGGIQEAAATALLSSQECVDQLVRRYESRRNVFINALQEIGWGVKAPEGSFFAWLPVPEGFTSVSFSDFLLENAHVAVAPGVGFGQFGEGYVRVGLLTDEDRLLEAANRIKALNIF